MLWAVHQSRCLCIVFFLAFFRRLCIYNNKCLHLFIIMNGNQLKIEHAKIMHESSLAVSLNTKIQKPIDLNLLHFFCAATLLHFKWNLMFCFVIYYFVLCYVMIMIMSDDSSWNKPFNFRFPNNFRFFFVVCVYFEIGNKTFEISLASFEFHRYHS